jgi:molybdopterin-containing oxidoreductase family iron-sulfur binding subunit
MNPRKDLAPELGDLWERLEAAGGKTFWRSLDELADTPAFRSLMEREFGQAVDWKDLPTRRQFLTLMGASLALAGLSGCSVKPAPTETMVPYVKAPEEIIPGRPLFYATAMTLGGRGVGLLVESHMGRPTKIEGNPQHPASLGATSPYHQASVLTLYDPDRSKTVTHVGQPSTWDEALAALREVVRRQRDRHGAKLRLLTETVVSPTMGAQLAALREDFREAQWHQYEPLAPDSAHRAATLGFGQAVNTYYRLYDLDGKQRTADVIVSLDADFLGSDPRNLRLIAEFAAGRRLVPRLSQPWHTAKMSRLYVIESELTATGAKADNRLAVRPSEIEGIARGIAAAVGALPGGHRAAGPHAKWVSEIAKDLRGADGHCVVIAGGQPPAVHLLAHAINQTLHAPGKTVLHTKPVVARPVDHTESLRQLTRDMADGKVEALLIFGGNPVFTAPADIPFKEAMQQVKLRAHLSLFQNETSLQCHWHLPEAHYLEAWSDTVAFDGTASIAQPLIQPLYKGRSAHEVLAAVTSKTQTPGYDIARAYWRKRRQDEGASASDFEERWQTAVHDGVVEGTALKHNEEVKLTGKWQDHVKPSSSGGGSGYELVLRPDPTIYDGCFANNGWLQELPKPITRLTWDNAALMSPQTAQDLGVGLGSYAHGGEHGGYDQPVVELELDGRKLRVAAWIVPGHADGAITLHLGYGREAAGKVGGRRGHKVGVNAYALRTAEHPWFAPGLDVRKTGDTYLLACVQEHHRMERRAPVRSATLDEFHSNPKFAAEEEHEKEKDEHRRAPMPLTMYEPWPYEGHRWGMAIDLTACVGCGACVVACQAENNIPVVGKKQVAVGREMHWIRIDRYLSGSARKVAAVHFQPLPCMHCESAPCEYVCPVEATVHSADGLNDMIYQRCVGTRFCSNNCPYKVRRFNFFFYGDYKTESTKLQYNPDVTVRSRGVMEKCTYCVQRIRHAEIDAQTENRPIADGEILTACQAACPASAIVFGDINNKKSEVRRWKESPLNYALLGEVNTEPRTTYLAEVRNPNPALQTEGE